MKRRDFLQMLGFAPIAVAAAKFLPKPKSVLAFDLETSGPITYTAPWQPCYAYKIGDTIEINGVKHTVTWAGISGNVEPLVKEEFMERL